MKWVLIPILRSWRFRSAPKIRDNRRRWKRCGLVKRLEKKKSCLAHKISKRDIRGLDHNWDRLLTDSSLWALHRPRGNFVLLITMSYPGLPASNDWSWHLLAAELRSGQGRPRSEEHWWISHWPMNEPTEETQKALSFLCSYSADIDINWSC